jgi:WD40 repeat protein
VRERIDAELAQLPEDYRLPLLLCYVQGLSYADVAQRIGCTLGALRGRLERGREALRRRLGRCGLPAVLVLTASTAPAVGAGLRDSTLAAVRSAGPLSARVLGVWVKWVVSVGFAAAAVVGIGLAAFTGPTDSPNSDPNSLPVTTAAAEKTIVDDDPLPPGALARMGSSRFHHGSNIHRLTVSTDGKWVISYGSHTGYRVWDLATGKEQVPVGMPDEAHFPTSRGQGEPVQWDAAIAPAGKRVVAVVPDRKQAITRIFDVVTGEEVASIPESLSHVLTRPSVSVDRDPEISLDGKWMMWTSNAFKDKDNQRTVRIVDLTTKTPKPDTFAILVDRELLDFTISADSQSVVFRFVDAIEVWDLATRKVKVKVPVVANGNWKIGHAVISPDGKTLGVVQPAAKIFQLWDVATKKELPAVAEPLTNSINIRCFSPDSKQVVASTPRGHLRVWDVATGKKVHDHKFDGNSVWAAAFTPDGKRLAVADMDNVVVLDLATGKPIHDFGGHNYSVRYVHFTQDGRLLSCAGSALVWDPRTGKKLGGFSGHPDGIYGITTSPDGRLFATCGSDRKIRLHDAVTLDERQVIDANGVNGDNIEFTPDGKEFAIYGDIPGIQMLSIDTAKQVRVIASGETATWLRFTPDGQRVVFGSWKDKKFHVWDSTSDKLIFSFDIGKESTRNIALSADGRFFATGDWDGHARVFDLVTRKQVHDFDTNQKNTPAYDANIVYAVAFAPDCRTLATGSANGTIHVWELATGSERFLLAGHRGPVGPLAFSPDGTILASGSSDRSVLTWDATGASLPVDPKHRPKDAADAWARLTDRDAAVGVAAQRYLADKSAEAVPLFAKHLRPVPAVDAKVVAALVEKLGSADFSEREAAEKELAAAGEGIASQLRAAAASESAEARLRIARLLAPFNSGILAGDRLRAVRTVESVERLRTAEAKKLLAEWAGGARGAELTEAARAALTRLGRGDSPDR